LVFVSTGVWPDREDINSKAKNADKATGRHMIKLQNGKRNHTHSPEECFNNS